MDEEDILNMAQLMKEEGAARFCIVTSGIHIAKNAGLEICCGGIIGMGEPIRDRLELAFTLRDLDVDSIPINILNPIKGTPIDIEKPIMPFEILKTISIFRLILPEKNKKHISGAENLVDMPGIQTTVSALVERALSHEKGETDLINITVESLKTPIKKVTSLPLILANVENEIEGKILARKLLKIAGNLMVFSWLFPTSRTALSSKLYRILQKLVLRV